MRKITITELARSDLLDIRKYTVNRHGHNTANSYETLLKQAIRNIRETPIG